MDRFDCWYGGAVEASANSGDRLDRVAIRVSGVAIFVVSFVVLAWLGMQASTPTKTLLAQIFTALYFAFFLLMPFYSKIDKTKPAPERVTK